MGAGRSQQKPKGGGKRGSTRLQQAVMQAGGNTNLLRGIVMQALGPDLESSAYALRYLHPMDETIHGGMRIPDEHSTYSSALEGRTQFTIAGPTPISGSSTWNCDMIVSAIPDVAYFYRTWIPGNPITMDWTPVPYAAFPYGNGHDSTATPPITGVTPTLVTQTTQYRAAFSGITCHLNAAGLNDAGMVYAGQFGAEYAHVSTGTPGVNVVTDTLALSAPVDENTLYQMCGAAIQQEAREGVYMPLMYNNPAQQFTQVGLGNAFGTTPGIPATQYGVLINGGNPITVPVGTGQSIAMLVSPQVNMTTGVILWRGLYNAATLQVKTRLGLECVPGPNSLWAPFTESSPPYQPATLAKCTMVRQRLPQAFPAHYNDLSSILDTIGGIIMGPVRGVADMLGGAGIPVISDIASTVGGGLGFIKDLFGM